MAAVEQPKIKLYWLSQSRSQRIVWLLEELGVPYEVEIFHRNKETFLAPPELQKIHPLGKSPILTITPPRGETLTFAESGWMTQYLCEHFPEGRDRLTPKRWRDGMEGKIGGETEEWLRWQYFLHYNEGSLMPLLVTTLIIGRLKSPQVPFLIRPITSAVASRMYSAFTYPNGRKHIAMIDEYLKTSPGGGKFLCGDHLTAADILMSFPLIIAKQLLGAEVGPWEGGSWEVEFPRVAEYVQMLEGLEGYKKAEAKVRSLEGGDKAVL